MPKLVARFLDALPVVTLQTCTPDVLLDARLTYVGAAAFTGAFFANTMGKFSALSCDEHANKGFCTFLHLGCPTFCRVRCEFLSTGRFKGILGEHGDVKVPKMEQFATRKLVFELY